MTPLRPVLLARFALAFAVAAPLSLAACDVFAIACNDDEDCPGDVPFCVDDICVNEDEAERRGRDVSGEGEGEGEGEATCASSSECGDDLCFTVAGSEFTGLCVPRAGDDDESCAEAALLGTRQTGAAAIFAASAVRAGGDCSPGTQNLTIEFTYFDEEGDLDPSFATLFVMPQNGSSPFIVEGGSLTGQQDGSALFFDRNCYDDAAAHVAIRLGVTSPTTNALCVALTDAP